MDLHPLSPGELTPLPERFKYDVVAGGLPAPVLPSAGHAMKIDGLPFSAIDWSTVPVTEHPGENGTAYWRTREFGGMRLRMVEYSLGYRADHWCSKGHVVLVLEGELRTELQDGTVQVLGPGMSYQVADDLAPHRSASGPGARLFIVD
jgi:hypothetical protein